MAVVRVRPGGNTPSSNLPAVRRGSRFGHDEPVAVRLEVEGTGEALDYLEEIAAEMVLLFPITMDEAVSRINRELRDQRFTTPAQVNVLLHEEQDQWAKHIYFGRASCWWLDEAGTEPLPYP